jgi:hypothetical protein
MFRAVAWHPLIAAENPPLLSGTEREIIVTQVQTLKEK